MDPPYGKETPGFVPQFWGMFDDQGNLQLIANYNNDLGEFWEWVDKAKCLSAGGPVCSVRNQLPHLRISATR